MKTLERWCAKRMVGGLILYESPKDGSDKVMVAFDPPALARWRESRTIGKPRGT